MLEPVSMCDPLTATSCTASKGPNWGAPCWYIMQAGSPAEQRKHTHSQHACPAPSAVHTAIRTVQLRRRAFQAAARPAGLRCIPVSTSAIWAAHAWALHAAVGSPGCASPAVRARPRPCARVSACDSSSRPAVGGAVPVEVAQAELWEAAQSPPAWPARTQHHDGCALQTTNSVLSVLSSLSNTPLTSRPACGQESASSESARPRHASTPRPRPCMRNEAKAHLPLGVNHCLPLAL